MKKQWYVFLAALLVSTSVLAVPVHFEYVGNADPGPEISVFNPANTQWGQLFYNKLQGVLPEIDKEMSAVVKKKGLVEGKQLMSTPRFYQLQGSDALGHHVAYMVTMTIDKDYAEAMGDDRGYFSSELYEPTISAATQRQLRALPQQIDEAQAAGDLALQKSVASELAGKSVSASGAAVIPANQEKSAAAMATYLKAKYTYFEPMHRAYTGKEYVWQQHERGQIELDGFSVPFSIMTYQFYRQGRFVLIGVFMNDSSYDFFTDKLDKMIATVQPE